MSKLKYLYATGDSWMAGDGVEEKGYKIQGTKRCSKLLSDKLGLIEINESTSGGSNDRMVRRTIEWFDNNIDKWDEVLVVLGFTTPHRMEYWDPDEKWVGWNAYSYNEFIVSKPDKKWWEKYVTLFLHDVNVNYNLKNQILLLTSFFDSNNIKYLMFFSWGEEEFDYTLWNPGHPSGSDYKTINKKYIISETFKEYIENKLGRKKALTKCDHASVDGHKIWTEKLYEELVDRKVL